MIFGKICRTSAQTVLSGGLASTSKPYVLYRLIWQRSVASSLADAKCNVNTVMLGAANGAQTFELNKVGAS
ncbi:hypothetical protein LPH43_06945 [Xylella taiwanensis]|uniref:Uncharacterized protein n=1 Tax=Xylella taiwanensis TaxID=1444770 RepID=Z9JK31_9GAMM|nr:hypothetical protein [Xylella taiwanensis]AXI82685.1 hypothetical protein AB672_01205 [Xylella taiwanensis]EWS78353.1 hypothetical protein AF72_06400 [Xylella taiwanensis]MCD8469951.1 hypothetical protein [Xylella taiwanensis]UFN01473.1 hypothetical protein LPH43_06945 [Xylella taiwanensis]